MGHSWLPDMSLIWGVFWQTSLCLGLGLLLSRRMRRSSGRAHFVLLLSLAVGLLLPLANLAVRQSGWGLLPPGREAAQQRGGSTDFFLPHPGIADHAEAQTRGAATGVWVGWSWPVRIAVCCLVVSALLLLRMMFHLIMGLRLLARARPLVNERLQSLLELALERLGLARTPITFATSDVRCPAIWCWAIHPALLLPEPMVERPNSTKDEDWISIFCHELSHMQRRDHLPSILAEITCCLLWWQPLAWLCRDRLHRLSDEACDQWVVARGQSAADYAELLLNLAVHPRSLTAFSMVSGRRGLKQRLGIILQASGGQPQVGARWAIASTLMALCFMTLLACVQPGTPRFTQRDGIPRFNLIADSGMELGDRELQAWHMGVSVEGVEYLWDHQVARNGRSSLCLRKTAERYFPIAEWTQSVNSQTLGQARRLRLSGWVRAEQVHKAILDVQFINDSGEWSHHWAAYIGSHNAGDPPVDHDWKQYEGVVDVPEGTKEISVGLQIYGPGTVWFDDLELAPVEMKAQK